MAFNRWRSEKKGKKETSSMTMADIVRGIQYCVNSSLEIVEQHYATFMKNFIQDDGKLRTRKVYISDDYVMELPDICLATHNSLALDEMEVKMDVCIKSGEIKKASMSYDTGTADTDTAPGPRRHRANSGGDDDFEVSRSSFDVELGSPSVEKDGSTKMELTMKFKAGSPPEALCRVIDQLNNAIVAKYVEK